MNNFCPECGVKLEQKFNFCPNCGSMINLSSSKQNLDETLSKSQRKAQKLDVEYDNLLKEFAKTTTPNVNICPNCGDENTLDSKVCHSCGVKLNNAKTFIRNVSDEKKIANHTRVDKIKGKKQNKSSNKNNEQSSIVSEKKLDTKKVIIYIAGSLVLVFLILSVSGVFDLSRRDSANVSSIEQNQDGGIDLNSISKINELKSIVEKNPENASAILDLANLRFDSGFFEDATQNYEQYLKLNPKNVDARIDMAVCYYNLQQFDKAESEILAALRQSPNHQIGYLNLGVVYLAKQNIEKAKEWFNKAVNLDPNSEIGKKAKSLLQSH